MHRSPIVSLTLLPWVNLEADWRPAAAPPGSPCSDRSPPAQRAASSGAYRPIQRDGYTATGGYSETSRDVNVEDQSLLLLLLLVNFNTGTNN